MFYHFISGLLQRCFNTTLKKSGAVNGLQGIILSITVHVLFEKKHIFYSVLSCCYIV